MTAPSIKEALELKPCPFCGGKPELLNGGPGNWFVRCTDCKCTTNDVQKDAAVQLWHRRAALATLSPPAGERREAIARQIDPVAFDNIGLLAKGRQRVAFEATDRLFASGLVQDERGAVATWMIQHGYVTGHGDTLNDLLGELVVAIRADEREKLLGMVTDKLKAETSERYAKGWNNALIAVCAAIRAAIRSARDGGEG